MTTTTLYFACKCVDRSESITTTCGFLPHTQIKEEKGNSGGLYFFTFGLCFSHKYVRSKWFMPHKYIFAIDDGWVRGEINFWVFSFALLFFSMIKRGGKLRHARRAIEGGGSISWFTVFFSLFVLCEFTVCPRGDIFISNSMINGPLFHAEFQKNGRKGFFWGEDSYKQIELFFSILQHASFSQKRERNFLIHFLSYNVDRESRNMTAACPSNSSSYHFPSSSHWKQTTITRRTKMGRSGLLLLLVIIGGGRKVVYILTLERVNTLGFPPFLE